MKLLFSILLALLVAVLVGQAAESFPGVVVISVGDFIAQTTLVTFVLLLAVAVVALRWALGMLGALWHLPRSYLRWSSERRHDRGQRLLTSGLRLLAEGHFHQAERQLVRGAAVAAQPELHYLAAADAAIRQNELARHDDYLRLAAESESAALAVGIAQAEQLMDTDRAADALAALRQLTEQAPGHAHVLRLTLEALLALGDSQPALDLLPAYMRAARGRTAEAAAMEERVLIAALGAAPKSLAAVRGIWRRLPAGARRRPKLIALHARNLAEVGAGREAERLLRQALGQSWDAELVSVYGRIDSGDPRAQLDRAESWLRARGQDADLLYAMAELCRRNELWGQARSHLESALAIAPRVAGYQALTEVLDRVGDTEAAMRASREGLRLASGAAAPPAVRPLLEVT